MRAYLLSHASAVVGAVASVIMVLRLLGTRRTSQSVLAWLLAIVFVPFVAIPLYLLLGSRKFPRRAKLPAGEGANGAHDDARVPPYEKALQASGVPPVREGNSFEILMTGEHAYARLMELIAGAERTIDLTTFILGKDATGHAVVDALALASKRGVNVRVILDGVGSSMSLGYARRELGAAGAEVRTFMPLAHSPIRGRTNLRSHRKLIVFDGTSVFVGGMNLATEYMGPVPLVPVDARWRDVAAVARGPLALDAEAMFESDWAFCGGARRPALARKEPEVRAAEPCGSELVQLVPSGPDFVVDTVYDLFLGGIFDATERVTLVTPYYVPDDSLQHALVLAARRHVVTTVIVPRVSNHGVADVARRSLLRELVAAGVHVRYYPRGMVHAKAMVIDASFAYVGSPNFDMRSLFLNYENAVCAYSPGAIAQVRAFVDGLNAECEDTGPPGREHPILEQLARFLAPEL